MAYRTEVRSEEFPAVGLEPVRPATNQTVDETVETELEALLRAPESEATRTLPTHQAPKIAVLIPCRDEEVTIDKVVRDFQRALPTATVFVYDNASTDHTAQRAQAAGAVVRRVPAVGKGNVVRRMFAEIEADFYVVVDGDDTYDADAVPVLLCRMIESQLDMVVGARRDSPAQDAYRRGHRFGNRLLTRSVHWIFRDGSMDMLSGYRVVSRRFAKSFPALSRGFETETEMTVHALEMSMPIEEVMTDYRERPTDSRSKLRSLPDGLSILKFIFVLWRDYRPFGFFGAIAMLFGLASAIAAVLGQGHLHAWTPATFAVVGLASLAALSFLAGVVLDSVGRRQREAKRMMYLAIPPLSRNESAHGLRPA